VSSTQSASTEQRWSEPPDGLLLLTIYVPTIAELEEEGEDTGAFVHPGFEPYATVVPASRPGIFSEAKLRSRAAQIQASPLGYHS
jgi:hypothetical protein